MWDGGLLLVSLLIVVVCKLRCFCVSVSTAKNSVRR